MGFINNNEMRKVLDVPFVRNTDGISKLKELVDTLRSGGDKEKEAAQATWNEKVFNYLTAPHRAMRPEEIGKNFESLGGSRRSTIDFYRSWTDELAMDMDWMPFFRMTSTVESGSATVDIIDFDGAITVSKLDDGEAIPMTTYGSDSRTRLTYERWGTGLPFLNQWLRANDLYSINDAMSGIRTAFMAKKADEAYTALGVAGTGTTTVVATPTISDHVTSLNNAATALLKRVSDSGFNLSAQVPLLIISAIDHQDTILQLFEQTSAGDGVGPRPRFRIVPVFTFNSNFPTQITASKDSYNLVLPGRKIIWNSFQANRTAQEVNFSTDSVNLLAQEYWNKNVPADQVQTVNLDN